MALSANQLEILITAKDTATKVVSGVAKSMKGLATTAGNVGKRITSAFANVGKSLLSFKAAFVAAAGAAGIGYAIKQSYDYIDTLGKTSTKLGLNVESLQKMRFAAEQAGVSTETLDMAMQRFTRRAAEAAKGTGEAKDALAQMGITLTKGWSGNLKSGEELLGNVADALMKVKDPAEQVRLAFKLFDSEGVAMINMLKGGSEGLNQFYAQAESLGFLLNENTVNGVERANDAFNMMGNAIGGVWNKLAGSLAPALEKFGAWWANWVGAFSNSIQPAIEWIGTYMKSISADFDAARVSGAAWGQTVTDGFFRLIELAVEAKAELDAFIERQGGLSGIWQTIKQEGAAAWNSVKSAVSSVLKIIDKVESALDRVSAAMAAFKSQGGGLAGIGAAVASITGATSYDVPSGSRASGGGVMANKPYLVGERGAELFTPSTSGNISASGGGGTTIVNNIYTAATSHGINNALASRGDTSLRTNRVGMNVAKSSTPSGFTNLTSSRSR